MEDTALRNALLELASRAELAVRTAGGRPDEPVASGLCRLRGEVWVVLSRSDPVEVHIEVLADALRKHAADFLEGHYLSPAVRARLVTRGAAGIS